MRLHGQAKELHRECRGLVLGVHRQIEATEGGGGVGEVEGGGGVSGGGGGVGEVEGGGGVGEVEGGGGVSGDGGGVQQGGFGEMRARFALAQCAARLRPKMSFCPEELTPSFSSWLWRLLIWTSSSSCVFPEAIAKGGLLRALRVSRFGSRRPAPR